MAVETVKGNGFELARLTGFGWNEGMGDEG